MATAIPDHHLRLIKARANVLLMQQQGPDREAFRDAVDELIKVAKRHEYMRIMDAGDAA